jgi:hypothetical protein
LSVLAGPARAVAVALTLGAETGWCSRATAYVLQSLVLSVACCAAVPAASAMVGDVTPTLWWLLPPAVVSLMYTLPDVLTSRHAAAEDLRLNVALVRR